MPQWTIQCPQWMNEKKVAELSRFSKSRVERALNRWVFVCFFFFTFLRMMTSFGGMGFIYARESISLVEIR